MRRYLTLVVGAALLALVAVIALAARELPMSNAAPRLDVRWDLVSLGVQIVVAGIIVGFVIWRLLPGGRRPRRKRRQGRSSSIAGAFILLAILLVLMRLGGFTIESPATTTTTRSVDSSTSLGAVAEPPPTGSSLGLVIVVAAISAVALALLASRKETPMDHAEAVEDARELVVDAIDDLLDDLDTSDDPRRVVIGAYARMEQALARGGVPRKRAESPRQYLSKVLRTLDVSERTVARLTALFEEARFSPHDIDLSMALEARSALREVRDQLGATR